jgi:hypothetical protein
VVFIGFNIAAELNSEEAWFHGKPSFLHETAAYRDIFYSAQSSFGRLLKMGSKKCKAFYHESQPSAEAARASIFAFALVLAQARGVNPLNWVILAAGKRGNKFFE